MDSILDLSRCLNSIIGRAVKADNMADHDVRGVGKSTERSIAIQSFDLSRRCHEGCSRQDCLGPLALQERE